MTRPAGAFCWFECATRDVEREKAFYSMVFGWEPVDTPMPGEAEGAYTLLQVGGADVAGMYELAGPRFESVPPHWMSYVKVEDADAVAEEAAGRGAEVLMAPFDVPGVGRMAFLADPLGAHFAIFQAGDHAGVGDDSGLGWVELHTTDTDTASEFYCGLFGWTAKPDQEGHYTEFLLDGTAHAGMMALAAGQVGEVPPHWLPYAMVDDCDARLRLVTEHGGRVVVPATDIEGVGRFAVFSDPAGAHLAMIKLSG